MKMRKNEKEILKEFLKIEICREMTAEKSEGSEEKIKERLKEISEEHGGKIRKLIENGYLEKFQGKSGFEALRITEKGRKKLKVVLCGGVFDIIHSGHIYMLSKAKKLGDFLAVVVARDATVKKRKRIPIVSEKQRVEILNNIKAVDIAFLGDERDYFRVLSVVKPDIVALGYDQEHDADEIKKEAMKRKLNIEVVRIEKYNAELASTREIINRIIKEYKE